MDITKMEKITANFSDEQKERFQRIFLYQETTGSLNPPQSMVEWINRTFGEVGLVRKQKIIKITNRVTMEGCLFNTLRAKRPFPPAINRETVEALAKEEDMFCKPLEYTSEDTFGRISGKYCLTAANIAKYDGYHAVIIFDEHNPLKINADKIRDYLQTARNWAVKAHEEDPSAVYYFFLWNCLWKSGASIVHGHAQATLSKGFHYAKVEHLRKSSLRYREENRADYFADLWEIHNSLGLAWETEQVRAMVSICPIKDKEIILIGKKQDESLLAEEIWRVLRGYLDMGVESFNLVLYTPPLGLTAESWDHFPCQVRIVDRGALNNRTNDIGAMELYASSVISADPWNVFSIINSQ